MQAAVFEACKNVAFWLLWPALLHSVWLGLVTASVVAILFRISSELSHQKRYAILMGALALVILGPIGVSLFVHGAAGRNGRVGERESVMITGVEAGTLTPAADTESRLAANSSDGESALRSRPEVRFGASLALLANSVRELRPFMLSAWLLGVMVSGGFLLLGSRALDRLVRKADLASDRIQSTANELAHRLRLKKSPCVLVHASIAEPCLCGLFRPAILLPRNLIASAGENLVDAILAHELAHARRLDHVVNVVQRLVEMVLFFHPGVHWLSRSLRRHREFCADALAVGLTGDPLALAGLLESTALLRRGLARVPAGASSLGGQSSSLLPRIQELLGMKPSRTRVSLWPFAALPFAAFFALAAASASRAQEPQRSLPAAVGEKSNPTEAPLKTPEPLHVAHTSHSNGPEQKIVYEVRFLTGNAKEWRGVLEKEHGLAKEEGDCRAWVIDEKTLSRWLEHVQIDASALILQAPKVTTNDGGYAFFFNGGRYFPIEPRPAIDRVSTAPDIAPDESGSLKIKAARPVVAAIPVGSKIGIKGKLLPGKVRMAVEVRDSSLLPGTSNTERSDQSGILERRSEVSCDVPDGSYLAICMGLSKPRETHLDPRIDTSQRLIVFIVAARAASAEESRVKPPWERF